MPAGYGKGRATGYTDYYKGRERTPGGSYDDEEDQSIKKTTFPTKKPFVNDQLADNKRKAAIKRRLAQRRAGK